MERNRAPGPQQAQCPLWVKSGHVQGTRIALLSLSARIRADALGAIYDRRHRVWVSTDDKRLILLYEIQERSLAGSFTRLHFAFDVATNDLERLAECIFVSWPALGLRIRQRPGPPFLPRP